MGGEWGGGNLRDNSWEYYYLPLESAPVKTEINQHTYILTIELLNFDNLQTSIVHCSPNYVAWLVFLVIK